MAVGDHQTIRSVEQRAREMIDARAIFGVNEAQLRRIDEFFGPETQDRSTGG